MRAFLLLVALWAAALPVLAANESVTPGCHSGPNDASQLPEGVLARVIIDPEPVVRGAEILLGDVACLEGDPEVVERLRTLSVGAAPIVGSVREYETAAIALRLRQGGIDDRAVEIIGPKRFTVKREAAVIPARELQEIVEKSLGEHLPQGARLSIVFQQMSDVVAPPAPYEVRLERLPPRLSGPISLNVGVYVDGKLWRSLILRAEAKVEQPVWVATRTIMKGEPLGEHNTELRFLTVNGVQQPAHLSGERPLRSNRVIQAGSLIEARFVEVIPDAAAGHAVIVTLSAPGLHLETRGILMADGMIGELVPVRNADSGAVFMGRLVNSDQVVVELP